MSSGLSRRDLFSIFGRTVRATVEPIRTGTETPPAKTTPSASVPEQIAKVAVIQGRFCLAYSSFCTVCSERCPVPGAMKVENGIPMIVSDVCTGCGVCYEVCPAPTNAVLLIPRRRTPRLTSPPSQPDL